MMRRLCKGIAIVLTACLAGLMLIHLAGTNQAEEAAAEEAVLDLTEAVRIRVTNDSMEATFEETSEMLSEEDLSDKEITFDGSELSIGKAGTYILSGELDGKISISSSKKKEVVLVLDGLTVENKADEALSVKKTGNLILVLNEGTENVFTSGVAAEDPDAAEMTDEALLEASEAAPDVDENAPRVQEAAPDAGEEMPAAQAPAETSEETDPAAEEDPSGGAVHIKSETVIRGDGSLIINGYINNGLQVSKTLTIESGTIAVNALNNAVKVKDTFTMNDGSLSIYSGDDGIKAEKDAEIAAAAVTDPDTGEVLQEAEIADPEKGDIIINGGQITIGCYGSGLQARLNVIVNAGEIGIRSGKDAINADQNIRISSGAVRIDSYQDGMQAEKDLTIAGGTIDIKTEGEYKHKNGEGESSGRRSGSASTPSRKGLKSNGNLSVAGGTITIDASDDAFHCAELLKFSGGDITVSTGDDGLHSDKQIDFTDGSLYIKTSYEGIEANQVNVSGGSVIVVANDDGFNCNGGSGSFGGQGNSNRSTEHPNLNISGGSVYVYSGGDGLDSNGSITISGGYTIVDGPTSSMNGALDGGTENGGTITISGGTIFAGGASGMAEGFASNSSQCSFMCTLSSNYMRGTEISVYDYDGNQLFSHTPESGGSNIVFSCPELEVNGTYILKIGETESEFTLNKVSSSFRISNNGSVTTGSGGSGGGPGR